MNVVLFHIGDCDERQLDYAEKFPLYKKCYDSVLREFKDDNIIVFHSVEEVFEKFPLIKKIIENNTSFLEFKETFFSSKLLYIYLDLIRTLLTFFLKDFLYLDSDIYVSNNLKNEIVSFITSEKNLYFYKDSMSIFYSKQYTSSIQCLLKRFNKNYSWDIQEIKESGLLNQKDILEFQQLSLEHFGGLRRFQESKHFKILENFNENIKKELQMKQSTENGLVIFNKDTNDFYFLSRWWELHCSLVGNITFEDFMTQIDKKELISEGRNNYHV